MKKKKWKKLRKYVTNLMPSYIQIKSEWKLIEWCEKEFFWKEKKNLFIVLFEKPIFVLYIENIVIILWGTYVEWNNRNFQCFARCQLHNTFFKDFWRKVVCEVTGLENQLSRYQNYFQNPFRKFSGSKFKKSTNQKPSPLSSLFRQTFDFF